MSAAASTNAGQPPPTAKTNLHAALLMLVSTLAFGLMAVTIRLASRTLPTLEVAFFRNGFGLLALLPVLLGHARQLPRTRQLPRYLLRSAIGLASMLAGFWAIGHLPLAQAISLSYSAPIFVTIGAVVWLGEKVRLRRWVAVGTGFIGVLIVVQPGTAQFTTGALVALLAAVLNAVVSIQIKQLARIDSPDAVVFYTYAFWVPLSLIPALWVWQAPQGSAWLWLGLTGALGTGGQLLWTRALKLGEVSALTPISFMQLPIVAGAGWLLFGEAPTPGLLCGAAVIFTANAYIAHREAVLARQREIAGTGSRQR